MGFDLGGLIGGIGKIVGDVGASGDPSRMESSVSGYATLPQERADFMANVLGPDIEKFYGTPFKGIPKRMLDASDADPIFGSLRRRQFAAQKINALPRAGASKAATTDTSTSAANPAGYSLPQIAAQYLSGISGKTPGRSNYSQDIQTGLAQGRYTLEGLGKALQEIGYNGTSAPNMSSGFQTLLNTQLAGGKIIPNAMAPKRGGMGLAGIALGGLAGGLF